MFLLSSADFFQNELFKKLFWAKKIKIWDPNGLLRLSADDKNVAKRERVNTYSLTRLFWAFSALISKKVPGNKEIYLLIT